MYTIQNHLDIITQTGPTLGPVFHTCCLWYILNSDPKEVPINSYQGLFLYFPWFFTVDNDINTILRKMWCNLLFNSINFLITFPILCTIYITINSNECDNIWNEFFCYLDCLDSKFTPWVTKYKHKQQLPRDVAHLHDNDLQRLGMCLANTWEHLSSSASLFLITGLLLDFVFTTSWSLLKMSYL